MVSSGTSHMEKFNIVRTNPSLDVILCSSLQEDNNLPVYYPNAVKSALYNWDTYNRSIFYNQYISSFCTPKGLSFIG